MWKCAAVQDTCLAFDQQRETGLESEHAVYTSRCDSGLGHELTVRAATPYKDRRFVVFAGCYCKEIVGSKSILFRGIDNVHSLHVDVIQDGHVQRTVQQVTAWLLGSTDESRTNSDDSQCQHNGDNADDDRGGLGLRL